MMLSVNVKNYIIIKLSGLNNKYIGVIWGDKKFFKKTNNLVEQHYYGCDNWNLWC